MYSLIPYPQNQTPNDLLKNQNSINKQFSENTKIQGLVSYIYYPSQRTHPFIGHAELEIEGNSHTLMAGIRSSKKLSHMIDSTQSGDGFPFFRIPISVTPNELRALQEKSLSTYRICSMGVAQNLANHANYKIPWPAAFSPSVSFIYLMTAKTLGSQRIKKVEFYKGPNQITNLAKIIRGLIFEQLAIYCGLYVIFELSRYISKKAFIPKQLQNLVNRWVQSA